VCKLLAIAARLKEAARGDPSVLNPPDLDAEHIKEESRSSRGFAMHPASNFPARSRLQAMCAGGCRSCKITGVHILRRQKRGDIYPRAYGERAVA